MEEDTKFCDDCKKNVVRSMFDKHSSTNDKLHPRCKECRKKERREKNFPRPPIGTKIKCTGQCNQILDESQFHSDRQSSNGLRSQCKECTKISHSSYYSTLNGFIGVLYKDAKSNAKKRKIKFEITREDIVELYEKQKGICSITGKKMTYNREVGQGRNLNLDNISIDRIDSNSFYKKDNIQLVTKIANTIKWTSSMEEMCKICCVISDHYNSHGKQFLENIIEKQQIGGIQKDTSKGLTFKK